MSPMTCRGPHPCSEKNRLRGHFTGAVHWKHTTAERGQAALFAQACVADQSLCDQERLKQAAQREARARLVPPGNVVPLYFGGHP